MANTTYKFLGELHKSVDTALVDKAIPSSSVLRPQFLSNDYKGGRTATVDSSADIVVVSNG